MELQLYVTNPDGSQEGPYSFADLESRYLHGKYSEGTLVWHEGKEDWQPIETILSTFSEQNATPEATTVTLIGSTDTAPSLSEDTTPQTAPAVTAAQSDSDVGDRVNTAEIKRKLKEIGSAARQLVLLLIPVLRTGVQKLHHLAFKRLITRIRIFFSKKYTRHQESEPEILSRKAIVGKLKFKTFKPSRRITFAIATIVILSGIGVMFISSEAELGSSERKFNSSDVAAATSIDKLLNILVNSPDKEVAAVARRALRGDLNALNVLGITCMEGPPSHRNAEMGLKMIRQAAEGGDGQACYNMGVMYMGDNSIVIKNEREGMNWLKKSAEAGYTDGEFLYGECLMIGEGCKADASTGLRWIRRAAAKGHPDAKHIAETLQGIH